MYGGLLKDVAVLVIISGDLPAPPPHGNDPTGGVPLHALHHGRAVDGSILNQFTLKGEEASW